MATAPEPTTDIEAGGETRTRIHGLDWDGCLALMKWYGDDGPRMAYADGDLELMTAYPLHGLLRKNLDFAIAAIFEGLDIPFRCLGATTFVRPSVECLVEHDECYYQTDHVGRNFDFEAVDLDRVPPPDLGVEVELTPSLVDRLGIAARMGYPEVWRHDGANLTVHVLGPDARYAASPASRVFPFVPLAELEALLASYDFGDMLPWRQRVRAWISGTVEPLARAGRAGAG